MVRHSGTCCSARLHTLSRPSVDGSAGCAAGPPGPPGPVRGGGGSSPTILYARLPAHVYEITTPDSTTMKRGTKHQRPITLCQLKSRALLDSPRLNHVTFLSWGRVHFRGHQM